VVGGEKLNEVLPRSMYRENGGSSGPGGSAPPASSSEMASSETASSEAASDASPQT
jgi:hypothetical protein